MKSNKTSFIFIFIIVAGISACQPSGELMRAEREGGPKPASLLAVIFDTSRVFSSNFTGFALYDPTGDTMLYVQNGNKYFTPASNTKLFTFYTGLKLLPDSLPALDYIVRGDSLIFWGTGDPSFLHPDFGIDTVYHFLKNRPENLYYSDAHFRDELLGPGWSWSDYNHYYSAERSPFPIYGNVVRFTMQKIEINQIEMTAQGWSISPLFFRTHVQKKLKPGRDALLLSRNINGNIFEYKPEADTVVYTVDKPFHYTPRLITQMLSDTLGRPVGYLEMEKPENTHILYSISSDTAFKRMLQPSDNFIAEQLLLVTASVLGKPLEARGVIEYVKTNYLKDLPDEPQWVDGSGLSRYNLFTPRDMIRLLEKIDAEFVLDKDLFELLPAGGESGTIENWYAARDGGPAYVFAKTGTLSNNHCLSGFVITRSGRKLIFSFMNNHYVSSSSVVKQEMEKVLWFIYQNY